MKTVTINVFEFAELSEKSQNKAISDHRENMAYPFHDDVRESLLAFAKAFGAEVNCWGDKVSLYGDGLHMRGMRAYRYLLKRYEAVASRPKVYRKNKKTRKSNFQKEPVHCPFTGYWIDDVLLYVVEQCLRHPDLTLSVYDILSEAVRAWKRAVDEDIEYCFSDESIEDIIISNGCFFYEDGTRYIEKDHK